MEMPSSFHWKLMKDVNPELFTKWNEFCGEVNIDDCIPGKYRELMLCCMAYVLHCKPATITHTANAIEKFGCSLEEVFSVLGLAMMMGGAPVYRDACLNLEEYFTEKYYKEEKEQ